MGGLGREMHELMAELFPITRSVAGPGYRETLDRLEQVSGPLERHRFASGEQVLDWTVPREWTIREAWIKAPSGEKVVDFRDSNLHIVSHSVAVSGRFSRAELDRHLHSLPDKPDAIPYRTSYYADDWGFCLADAQRRALPDGEYEVTIDADLSDGHVEVGELTLPGSSPAEVLLSTYCCHPSLANNELSGPVVAAFLARELARRPGGRRLTYRFVFVPETIGAIAYLSRFGERLRRRLAAGYVVTCVGDPGDFTYKRSRRGDSLADRAAQHALRHAAVPHRIVDYYPAGSDERQYCSPGYNLPVGSLMRSMWGSYPEYHTSLDDLSLVTPDALAGSLSLYTRVIEVLEAAETWEVTVPYGEPQLGRRGLYPSVGGGQLPGAADAQRRIDDMMFLLNYCDGGHDLIDAGDRVGRPVWELRPVAESLAEHGLLKRADRARQAQSAA